MHPVKEDALRYERLRGASAVAVGSREFQICTTLTSLADTLAVYPIMNIRTMMSRQQRSFVPPSCPKWYTGVVFVAPT